jgi:tetratricopeptide (TPR) repeat protein
MDFNEQLRLLQAAQGDPQRQAVATLDILLASQPPELRRAFEAAAIPHWFDERLLAALLDQDLRADSQRWFEAVIAWPAVEPFPARQGYNVHEATRLGLRRRLFAENPERFREIAARAVAAFNGSTVHEEIERAYHLLAAEPAKAGPMIQDLYLKLAGRVEETLGFARALDEYADGDVWPPQARGWAFLLSARCRQDYRCRSETTEAAAKALQVFTEAQDGWASALAHQDVGDAVAVAGDLTEALAHLTESRRICKGLTEADPSNTGWQRDLCVSHSRLGNVLFAQGDLAGALQAYQDSLAVSQRLATADPSNAGWQRDLVVSCLRMAMMAERSGSGDALEWWRKAYETLAALKQRGIMMPTDEPYLEWLRGKTGNQG